MNLRFLLILTAAMFCMNASIAFADEPVMNEPPTEAQEISDPPCAFDETNCVEPQPEVISDPPCAFDETNCVEAQPQEISDPPVDDQPQEISDPAAIFTPTVLGDSTGTIWLNSFKVAASGANMHFAFRFSNAAPRVSRTLTMCVKTTTRGSFCLARTGRHIVYHGRMIAATITRPNTHTIRVKVKATVLNLKRGDRLTARARIQLLAPVCSPACTEESMLVSVTR